MPKRILAFALLLGLMICPAVFARDEGPAIAAMVDKRTIYIGDRLRYLLEADLGQKYEIGFPEFKENKIGDFEIKDSGINLKKSIFGRYFQQNWYDITSYDVGKHKIPESEIRYRKKGEAQWHTKKARAIEITVRSVLPPGRIADIKDIKGPLRFFEPWLTVIVATIFFILVLAVAIYRRMRRASPVKLPHETAEEELEAIRNTFARNNDIKEYYVGISDCVRRYVERVYRLKAPEMTTEEFLDSLKDSFRLSSDHKDLLKQFLTACDLVKFAKYTPGRPEVESVFIAAKKFIEETKEVFNKEETKMG